MNRDYSTGAVAGASAWATASTTAPKHKREELSSDSLDLSDDPNSDYDTQSNQHKDATEKTEAWKGIDNQRDHDGASSSCSSLSVEVSDAGYVSDDVLALSVSTESDPAAVELPPLSSDSDDDADAKAKVLLPEEAATDDDKHEIHSADASSLSGEMSSSGFEVQYIDDEDEEDEDDEADSDDELWSAFDAALATCEEGNMIEAPSTSHLEIAEVSTEDDGYDGSASESESVSSLDDSVDGSGDHSFYSGFVAEEEAANAIMDDSISAERLSLVSSSPISSVASSHGALASKDCDDSISSLEVSSDDEPAHQCIENIPISTTQPSYKVKSVDGAQYFLEIEYVSATKQSNSRRWRRGSDQSLTLEGEVDDEQKAEDEALASFATLSPTKRAGLIAYEHLEVHESYVSFADLAGIIESHVPHRPGLFLDFGCGTSRFCEELVFHGYHRVLGIDRDLSAIAFQRQQSASLLLPELLQFWPMGTSSSLLLPDRSSDYIMSKATLDGIAARCVRDEDPQELLATLTELIRCLRPGGVLMAVVFNDNECEDSGWRSPWWTWKDVERLISRQLSLVQQYDLGRPTLVDGQKTKPYKVQVWRRQESTRQRLKRLLLEHKETKRQVIEYETRLWMYHNQQARTSEEKHRILESRQMILEDERSRRERIILNEPEGVRLRQQRREAFYEALLEEERQQMTREDTDGMARRAFEHEMKTFIVRNILEGTVIGRAVDVVIAKEAEAERKRQEEVAKLAVLEATKAEALANSKRLKDEIWIRDLVCWLIDNLSHPQPQAIHPNQHQSTVQVPVKGIKALREEAEDPKVAVAAAAADAVARILSTAMSQLASPRHATKKPEASTRPLVTGFKATETAFNVATTKTEQPPTPMQSPADQHHDGGTETLGAREEILAHTDLEGDSACPPDTAQGVEQATEQAYEASTEDAVIQACNETIQVMLDILSQ